MRRCARTPNLTAVGFEPTPLRNGALSHRLRPLGQTVLAFSVLDPRLTAPYFTPPLPAAMAVIPRDFRFVDLCRGKAPEQAVAPENDFFPPAVTGFSVKRKRVPPSWCGTHACGLRRIRAVRPLFVVPSDSPRSERAPPKCPKVLGGGTQGTHPCQSSRGPLWLIICVGACIRRNQGRHGRQGGLAQ